MVPLIALLILIIAYKTNKKRGMSYPEMTDEEMERMWFSSYMLDQLYNQSDK